MSARSGDVAIIGMACLFPQAPDLEAYWENILAGVDAVGEAPADSAAGRILDPSATTNDRLYTTRGGYLGDLATFDPMEFGVMPRAVDGAEPEHFVALRLAHDALADAGYLDRPFNRRAAGIILGRGTYVNRGLVSCFQHTIVVDQVIDLLRALHPESTPGELEEIKRALKANLPPFNPETSPGLAHSVMCGRIANRLDLMGPAFTVDAACASTLIAVDLGIKELKDGACDLVLAGGIQISTTYPIALLFSQLGALARSGSVRPFHPEADGTLLGEGAGVVVLKRLEEALDDGDRIYSVLRSVGTASDGKAMGILAPRVEGEELAMRRAYERGGIDPDSVGLLEAHGTGTPVGDATEIEALRRVFGADDKSPRCALGSVKSMIGHCIPAAAAAGLIKAALAVYHNVLPPTLHADASNPRLAGSRFYLNTETRPWVHAGPAPRRAGVSAFGFGGINAHAILEEAPPVRAAARGRRVFARNLHARRESELFVLSAASRAGLLERCAAVRRFVAANPGVASPDLAYTLNCPGPEPGAARLAIVAASIDELEKKLAYAGERLLDPARSRLKEVSGIYFFEERLGEAGDPAFLFPGEGAQYPGMLADLCLHFPEARAWFDLMDRAFRDHHRGVLPSQVVFPPPGGETDQATRRLWEMDSAIESVFAANQALHAILTRLGVRPQAVAGHSTGEYSALLASGAAEAGDEGRLIEQILDGNAATERATRSGVVPQGVLLAVGPADEETLRSVLSEAGGGIFLAMDNCPHQVVLCGTEEAVGRVQLALRSRGAVCQRLPFGRAYHTPLFAPVCEELRGFYERARFAPPRVPLYSCASAAPVPADPEAIRRLALEQWCRPVRFRETIEAMYAAGIRVFVEVGPRGNLTAFVEDILRGRPHLAVASNLHRRPGITQLHHLLALLAAHGLPLRLEPLYEDRASRRLPSEALREGARLPARPDRALRLSLALPRLKVDDATLARLAPLRRAAAEKETTAARERSAVARAPVAPPGRAVPANGGGASGTAAGPGASVVIKDFLSTMDNFLKTQDEVLRSALGHAGRGGAAEEKGSPLAGRIVRRGAGGSLTFHRTLSLEEDLFLLDHTLGGRISADETLRPLSIVPLTMSLEMMAEAAAATAPGLRPVGLRSVRAHRWLALTRPRLALEVVATPRPGCGEVDVRVSEMFSDATPARLTLEAVVLLADRLSGAPAEAASAPRAARSSRWRPGDLYAEGQTHGMFHGPSFRGVVSIDRVGEDGAEATLRALPSAGLFRSGGTPPFLLDALLLDAASQVVGYWTAEFLERDFVVFPIGLDRLEIFAAPLAPPATARCRTRCDVRSDGTIRADLEIAGPDGRLLARLSGWEVKRIRLPERIYAFRLAPRDVLLSDPLPAPDPADDGVRCCRLEIDDRLLVADGGIWREGLAHLALAREEREAWRALSGSEARRGEWLVGRLAAKDAVRLFLKARHGLAVYPADVVIQSEGPGRPVAAGPWVETIGQAPALSLSHSNGLAVAIAGQGRARGGVGIDVERLRRTAPGFEDLAFTAGERDLLHALAQGDRDEWTLRLWCAKEAAAKALGSGLRGDPRRFEARAIDAGRGTVHLDVAGVTAGDLPGLAGSTLTAWTGRDGDVIVATAL